jgi:hypothetical protein
MSISHRVRRSKTVQLVRRSFSWYGLLIALLVVLDLAVLGYSAKFVPVGKVPLLDDLLGRVDFATLAARMEKEVLPAKGFQSKIVLGDLVPRMVKEEIIEMKKFEKLYDTRGGLTEEQRRLLTEPSTKPLLVTKDNASFLLNLLWPLGMSNRLAQNGLDSAENVNSFASTGGWDLGHKTGNFYYNQLEFFSLTPAEEERARRISESTYRPCCNNSTFFQDCNHGSGAMALIELGVKQGLSDDEIYKTLLAFNSYWFPQNYTEIAMFFKVVKHQNWSKVDPREVLSKEYSSISGFFKNVDDVVSKFPGYEHSRIGGGCSA